MATQAPDNDIAGTQAANQAALDSGQVKLGVAQGQQGYQIPNAVVGQNVSGNPTAPTPPQTSPQTGSGETMVNGQLTYTGNVGGSGTTAGNIWTSNPDMLASGQASGYLDANGNILNAPTQSDIYSSTLSQFQPQIDALNAAKAQAEANVRSQYAPIEANRIGSNIAQQGRGGELGSNVGQAQQDQIGVQNATELTNALEASDKTFDDQINSLYTNAQNEGQTSYNAKLTAYQKSAADAVTFKTTTAPQLAQTAATNAAAAALQSGIDLSDPAALNKWATGIAQAYTSSSGIALDPNAVIASYQKAKQAAETAAATNASKGNKTLSAGSSLVNDQGNIVATAPPKPQPVKVTNLGKYGTLETYPDGTSKLVSPASSALPTTKVQTATEKQTAAINTADNGLRENAGSDGYVSPQVYLGGRKAWIADGQSATTFDSKFSKYANPADLQDYR